MKKVILALAIVSVSFAACNDSKTEETPAADTTAVTPAPAVDTTAAPVVDTTKAPVADTTKK
jgi:hypothetical protein